jgi:integrase/recombinase XerD
MPTASSTATSLPSWADRRGVALDVSGLVQAYLDHLSVERGLSGHTTAAYRRDLQRYTRYLAGRGVEQPTKITTAMINEYALQLREGVRDPTDSAWSEPPLAGASVARAVVAVRSLHRFALAEGVTTDDPAHAVQPPRPPQRLPKALRLDQVQAMLDVPATDTPLGLRDAALLEVLYGTGMRISEAVALDVDDVSRKLAVADGDPTPGVRVLGKGRKERFVPLGSYARAALLNARGGRLSRQSAWTTISTVAERAGIQTDVSPHTLRHSFATHLLDGGADVRVVQELLGHASVTTTQIYTLVTVDHLREVYLTSHPRAH